MNVPHFFFAVSVNKRDRFEEREIKLEGAINYE
jgi:hypothetical protein